MVKKTIIPATKKLGKELIKDASPEHKLRVCAYVRVSTIFGECLCPLIIMQCTMQARARCLINRTNNFEK